eukprot:TRINITY_DN9235_c0_g1_i1.p1 TRINITY_DN9235_c0_g1~~TRINITY_DN9235_c0_g1_i1.p1  ORF type:complete len:428 (+),score=141.12 TRINITY_DN9235_c0_g1_i1:104-1285(+)
MAATAANHPAQTLAQAQAIEDFCGAHGLDEQAAVSLRAARPEVLERVLKVSDFTGVRDLSRHIMVCLRDAERAESADPQAKAVVADFVQRNQVDPRCEDALLSLQPWQLEAVLTLGDTGGTTNPSGAIMARIAAVRRKTPQEMGMVAKQTLGLPSGGYVGSVAPRPIQPMPQLLQPLESGTDVYASQLAAQAARQALGVELPTIAASPSAAPAASAPAPAMGAVVGAPAAASLPDVDSWIQMHGFDSQAEEAIRAARPEILQRVMQVASSMYNVRDVNKHIMICLREAERAATVDPYTKRQVTNFVRRNNLDLRCEDCLLSLRPDQLHLVLQQGDCHGATNPCGAIMGRIAAVKRGQTLPSRPGSISGYGTAVRTNPYPGGASPFGAIGTGYP